MKKLIKKFSSKTKETKSNFFDISKYGNIIFGVGLLIALVGGVVDISNQSVIKIIGVTLILFGIAVGFLNVTNKEAPSFLIAVISLLILMQMFLPAFMQTLGITNQAILTKFGKMFSNFIIFIAPAAIIVAFKTIILTAKDE